MNSSSLYGLCPFSTFLFKEAACHAASLIIGPDDPKLDMTRLLGVDQQFLSFNLFGGVVIAQPKFLNFMWLQFLNQTKRFPRSAMLLVSVTL